MAAPFEVVLDTTHDEPTADEVSAVAGEIDLGLSLALLTESRPVETPVWQLPTDGLADLASERVALEQQFADILSQVAPEPPAHSLVLDAVRWTFEVEPRDTEDVGTPWPAAAASDDRGLGSAAVGEAASSFEAARANRQPAVEDTAPAAVVADVAEPTYIAAVVEESAAVVEPLADEAALAALLPPVDALFRETMTRLGYHTP